MALRAIALGTATVVLIAGGCGSEDAGTDPELIDLAGRLQAFQSADYIPLDQADESLGDVASRAEIVGIGALVDVRLGYKERLSSRDFITMQQMYLVIEPEKLLVGGDDLGQSRLVYLEVAAPPRVDGQVDVEAISHLRQIATSATDQVVFMLDRAPQPDPDLVVDEFVGRTPDDPTWMGSHPSSVLGVSADGTAYPLLTDEQITDSETNLRPLRELGAQVERFTTAPSKQLDPAAP